MADVFEDHPIVNQERQRLWSLIERTPWLNWLLLTKRPQNVRSQVPARWLERNDSGFSLWLGTSVENQRRADERIPVLLSLPAWVRFLSCEPLLGPLDLSAYLRNGIDWAIVGGESGNGARPMDPEWARSLRDQCNEALVAFFFK